MIPQSRNNLFKLLLPIKFIPDSIQEKYWPYISSRPTPFLNTQDFISYSIQNFTFPSLSYDSVQQMKSTNSVQKNKNAYVQTDYRNRTNEQNLYQSKDFNITFQLFDGYVNWFILYDTFIHYYSLDNRKSHIDPIIIQILDSQGTIVMDMLLYEILFKSISELTFSYADNIQQFSTFDCGFSFNTNEIKLYYK